MQIDGETGYITIRPISFMCGQKQGLSLTVGTYKGCSDDIVTESEPMVNLVVVKLGSMDSLSQDSQPFFLENICLTRGMNRRVTESSTGE